MVSQAISVSSQSSVNPNCLFIVPVGVIISDAMKTKWLPHSIYYVLPVCFSAKEHVFHKAYLSFLNADKDIWALSMHLGTPLL